MNIVKRFAIPLLALAAVALYPATALAHCDAMDGPVVQSARAALEKQDVTMVLRWVPPDQEEAIRSAFARTVKVRAAGPDARELADTWFFETLVRIHRAGEGAPFDGLKPAGHIEPFMLSVDRSLESGSVDTVVADVTADVTRGVRERFARARQARTRADESLTAGRDYVAAYVDYLHYVEALHQAGAKSAEHAESAPHAHPEKP